MKIVSLKDRTTPKFGFQKVRNKKKPDAEDLGQLNLFEKSTSPKVIKLPLTRKPFEIALDLDERDDIKAEEIYQTAIEEGDRTADAYCNLGIIKSRKNKHREAIDCFTNALKESQEHFEAHYNLANLYFDMGYLEPARVHYEFASELDPDFANLYFNLGLLLAMERQYSEAIVALTTYLGLIDYEDPEAKELLDSLSVIGD